MLIENPHWLVRTVLPGLLWKVETERKVIYLTFDDGPIPEVTPWVLQQLNKYGAKASFFCVGENVSKYPEVFEAVRAAGHTLGNHSYNHIVGTRTDIQTYMDNVAKANELIRTPFFRPPHGLMTLKQMNRLKKEYKVVMWDVLTRDYDRKITQEECLSIAISYSSEGSIVVFHDSLKAESHLRYALPRFIEHFLSLGYTFEALSGDCI